MPPPGGSDNKESACNAGVLDSIHGPGRPPGERNGYPKNTQYSDLENSMDEGVWRATGEHESNSNNSHSLLSKNSLKTPWGTGFLFRIVSSYFLCSISCFHRFCHRHPFFCRVIFLWLHLTSKRPHQQPPLWQEWDWEHLPSPDHQWLSLWKGGILQHFTEPAKGRATGGQIPHRQGDYSGWPWWW